MPSSAQFTTMKIKELFFDRQRVQRSMSDKRHSALSRIGAFVMKDARQSIRFRKNPKLASAAGAPPFAHEKSTKKDAQGQGAKQARFKMIYFAYDETKDSVVIGQLAFRKRGDTTLPEAHEEGASLLIRTNRGHRGADRKKYRWEKVKYPARPYMRPALSKNVPRILNQFGGTL